MESDKTPRPQFWHSWKSSQHTQRDQCPWWEVDLGRLAVINTIEVWNREDVPIDVSQGEDYFTKRLFPCWMLVSTDPFPKGTGGQVR